MLFDGEQHFCCSPLFVKRGEIWQIAQARAFPVIKINEFCMGIPGSGCTFSDRKKYQKAFAPAHGHLVLLQKYPQLVVPFMRKHRN